jgi:phospholipid N-methyltransferase
MTVESGKRLLGGLPLLGHPLGCNSVKGSPHIAHGSIRGRVLRAVQRSVTGILDHRERCRVLEIGAGQGTFTDCVLAMGAEVEVTETSESNVEALRRRFQHDQRVTVTYDADGSVALDGDPVDIVLCISVLHHIPSYLTAVRRLVRRIAPGGAFVSFQDPLWYPRRSTGSLLAERGAHVLWRLGQGNLRRGLASFVRQRRGAYDKTNPSDMVEYHVVRKGVDELALRTLLTPSFGAIELHRYWSTNAGWLQLVGERIGPQTTFGLLALDRR